jgi:anti-sigma B factor antagonist
MHIENRSDGAQRRLVIEGDLTIYNATELNRALLAELEGAESLELELRGVAEMDSAGLQVLAMLKREAQHHGVELQLTQHSEAVYEVLERFGMQSAFGGPVLIPADWSRS